MAGFLHAITKETLLALDNAATLVVGAGNFFTAPYVEATPADLPTDLTVAPPAPWDNIGHTSLEDIFNITSEGGEANILATLQNRSLRTSYESRSETFNITLQQFDTAALKLYFGSNATVGLAGELQVPEVPEATISSFLAVFIDGNNAFGFYAPKAEILRSDDFSVADSTSLASLPLGIKPVKHGDNKWLYAVTPLGVV